MDFNIEHDDEPRKWGAASLAILIIVVVLAIGVLLTSCGGDDDDETWEPIETTTTTVPDDVFVTEIGNPRTSGWFVTTGPSGRKYECLRPSGAVDSPMFCFPFVEG